MDIKFPLNSNNLITNSIRREGITTLNSLCTFVKNLPYGRNQNRKDFTLVWTEQKGTCSSKHAFLKHVADLNTLSNVELILGMYKMNIKNTPKIGNALSEYQLDYIPEAHCYLKINDKRLDFTSPTADFNKLKNDILLEKEISPEQVAEFKVDFHKTYLKDWIKNNQVSFSFEDIWKIREQCITNLSG